MKYDMNYDIKPRPNNKGFTLIEVVISMAILAFLTLMMNQAIKRGTDFKKKTQKNIDQRSILDAAMRIIERDINLAFHYQDINTEVLKEVEKKKKEKPVTPPKGTPGAPPSPPQPPTPAPPPGTPTPPIYPDFKIREIPIYTVFLGGPASIHFTNLNNISDQPTAMNGDQQEVGYYVQSCKKIDDPDFTGKCLWRRTSNVIDSKVDEGGQASVLLAGIKKFELRYFGKQKEDWVNSWKSDGKEDESLKGFFPQAVEVTLIIEDNKKELTAIRVIPLRFPNNIEKPAPGQPGTTVPPNSNGGR